MNKQGWEALLKTRLLVLAAVAAVVGVAPAHAIGEFSSGPWRGEAIFKNARFSHCGMLSRQGPWRLVLILSERGAVNLGLRHAKLRFTKGAKIRGSLQADNGAATSHEFVAVSRTAVGVRFATVKAAESLTRASRLRVQVGEVSGNLSLTGLSAAFARLSACVAKRGQNQ